jgi:hypothetical protein
LARRLVQRRKTVHALGVDRGTIRQQQRCQGLVAVGHRTVQERISGVVSNVNLGPVGQQPLYRLLVTFCCVQSRPAIVIAEDEIRAISEQRPEPPNVAPDSRQKEFLYHVWGGRVGL